LTTKLVYLQAFAFKIPLKKEKNPEKYNSGIPELVLKSFFFLPLFHSEGVRNAC
jgi:hypothetical protein